MIDPAIRERDANLRATIEEERRRGPDWQRMAPVPTWECARCLLLARGELQADGRYICRCPGCGDVVREVVPAAPILVSRSHPLPR